LLLLLGQPLETLLHLVAVMGHINMEQRVQVALAVAVVGLAQAQYMVG
jgi:hypothetical protein